METLESSWAVTSWALLCPRTFTCHRQPRAASALSATLYLGMNDGNTSLVVKGVTWAIKIENGNSLELG